MAQQSLWFKFRVLEGFRKQCHGIRPFLAIPSLLESGKQQLSNMELMLMGTIGNLTCLTYPPLKVIQHLKTVSSQERTGIAKPREVERGWQQEVEMPRKALALAYPKSGLVAIPSFTMGRCWYTHIYIMLYIYYMSPYVRFGHLPSTVVVPPRSITH